MPVYRILVVKLYSLTEVLDSLLKVEEPVPHETPSIIRWCIGLVKFEDLIKIVKCLTEALAAHFLADRSQMMQCRNVILLKRYGLDVVSLCLFKFANLVPAEGPIVICLEMLPIKLYCPTIVHYSTLILSLLPVSESSVVIKISLSPFKLYGLSEAPNGLIKVPLAVKTYALIVIGECVVRVDAYRC